MDSTVHIRMVSKQMYPEVLNMPSMPSNPPNKPTLSYGLKCLHVQASLTIGYPSEQFQLAQPFNGAQSRKVLVKAVWVAHLGTLAEK